MESLTIKGMICISILAGLLTFAGLRYWKNNSRYVYHVTYQFSKPNGSSGWGAVQMVCIKPINSQDQVNDVTGWIKRDIGADVVIILGWQKMRPSK